MPRTFRDRLETRLTQLKEARQPYEAEWKEIARFGQPSRSRFLNSEQNKNFRRLNRSIYNGHAILAFRTLTGGMTSGLSSPSRPWFRLSAYDADLAEDHDVGVWLAEVEGRMYAFLSGTNFYSAVKAGYAEMGLFGTEACVMAEHQEYGAVCHALTAGEYWIGLSDANVPNTLYRRAPMTVDQCVRAFTYEKCSLTVRNMYDRAAYEQQVPVMHAIEQNDDRDVTVLDAKGKPWRSVYWEDGSTREDNFLRVSGYNEQPFWAPRWDTVGGDTYGTCPGHDALPDTRELQLQSKRKTEATDFMVWPELVTPASLKLKRQPKEVVSAASVDKDNVFAPYQMPYQAVAAIESSIEKLEQRVSQLTYADLFLAITNMQGIQPRNIEEIASRNEEKLTQLGPVIERVSTEKLEVAIDRTFGIMQRLGLLPPAPEVIQGQPVKVDFVSVLAQMQRMVGLGQMERTIGFIGNLAASFPEAADRLDIDETIDEYADRAGAPPRILRSVQDAQAIRQQRAQQQQNAQLAAAMPAVKDGAQAATLLAELRDSGAASGAQP